MSFPSSVTLSSTSTFAPLGTWWMQSGCAMTPPGTRTYPSGSTSAAGFAATADDASSWVAGAWLPAERPSTAAWLHPAAHAVTVSTKRNPVLEWCMEASRQEEMSERLHAAVGRQRLARTPCLGARRVLERGGHERGRERLTRWQPELVGGDHPVRRPEGLDHGHEGALVVAAAELPERRLADVRVPRVHVAGHRDGAEHLARARADVVRAHAVATGARRVVAQGDRK